MKKLNTNYFISPDNFEVLKKRFAYYKDNAKQKYRKIAFIESMNAEVSIILN